MSQRGGDVQSHLRISDKTIFSDLIPKGKADMIISVEPMESLRYLPWLKPEGWIITNSTPFVNIPNYPPIKDIIHTIESRHNSIVFDAEAIAKNLGSEKYANMVILGAASLYLGFEVNKLYDALNFIFGKKGDKVVQINIQAINEGRNIAAKKSA